MSLTKRFLPLFKSHSLETLISKALDEILDDLYSFYEVCTIHLEKSWTEGADGTHCLTEFRKIINQIFLVFLDNNFENIGKTPFFDIYQKIYFFFVVEKRKCVKTENASF